MTSTLASAPNWNPQSLRAHTRSITPRQNMISAITQGLTNASLKKCSRWSQRNRIMGNPLPGPVSFKYHPWSEQMHDDDSNECVGQKAAQMGYTETMLDRSFFTIDVLHRDVLYVLPAKTPDATDFSNTRFDPALELSPYLSRIFTNVNNVGLKRAGANSLYVRGSRSRSALVSIPVGLVILDEMDLFDEDTVPLVKERMSGQLQKQIWMISTPSIPNHGINERYALSNQCHFNFKCPHCSKYITLTFPDSLTIHGDSESDPLTAKSHLICTECRHVLDHAAKIDFFSTGKWVPNFPDRSIVGYHVSQLYSCVLHPSEIARLWIGAQNDTVKEQEFYNSKLGLEHIPKGSTIDDAILEATTSNHRLGDPKLIGTNFCTMGVDVGNEIHVEIDNWRLRTDLNTIDINDLATGRMHWCGTVKDFVDLDTLMYKFKPSMCVVDHLPDTRSAIAFAHRFPGRVKLCHYGNGLSTREIVDHGERITVDRTCWFDLSLSRFLNKTLLLPMDCPIDYKQHIKNMVRVPIKTKDKDSMKMDQIIFRYQKTGADHYSHCRNYSEMALTLCTALGGNTDIKERIK
jgi:hypothetical protein